MFVAENPPEVAASSRPDLPHFNKKHLVLDLDEDVLQRIGVLAEARGIDHERLAKEFIVERLWEEEKRVDLSASPIEINGGSKGKAPTSGLVDIYTDGGCRGNPGPGGWAAIIYQGTKPKEISGAEKNTINQRMEVRAAIEGLQSLKEPSRVRLYSDSAYLLNAMNEGWLSNWESNGWKTAKKKAVKNAGLWQELLDLAKPHAVKWVKVKGHAGNPGNERCDALVKLAMNRERRRG
jgi:ribonuclease HI